MNVKNRNRGLLLLLLALIWACGTKQEGKEKAMEEQTMEDMSCARASCTVGKSIRHGG